MSQTQNVRPSSELPLITATSSGCLPPSIQSAAPPELNAEVELAFLAKDSLKKIPEELKGLSVLSSEGKYLVVGPPGIAPAYGDHSVPLEVVIAHHKRKKDKLAPHPCYIHRLPTEVLCAIFLMCGDPNKLFAYPRDERTECITVNDSYGASFHIREVMVIGRVCWRWYTITRGCPQLWTMIDVPLPQSFDVAALKLSLDYSKGLPLTLRINGYHYTPPERRNVKATQQFMDLVAASACRWRELSIIMKHEPPTLPDMFSPLLRLPHDSFKSLARAMLRLENDDARRSITLQLWQMLYRSPELREVHWFYIAPNAPAATFQALTHVGVNLIYAGEIMDLLRACPQVQVLQAVVEPPPSVWPGTDDGYLIPAVSTPIRLQQMRVLLLGGMSDWTHLFDGIMAPNLCRLDITIGGIQAQPIRAMLKRSTARLRALLLRWIYPGCDDEIIELLRSDELKQLEILRYDAHKGNYHREPDHFDPSPYLPPHLYALTQTYEDAEDACQFLHIL